ncbi:uncharacterized protein YkwD [Roseateles asaccharophilus]|uniref:hypothetical protein n=1 Tax=Roseateles asaccharophilus TaxID=582607 RepID=UPI0038324B50
MTRTKTLTHVLALTLVASLAACGGGGGGGSTAAPSPAPAPAPTPAPAPAPVTVVADAGNLKATVPAPTYAASSVSADVFATLNAARVAAGAGQVSQDAKLDVASTAHAKYLTSNFVGITDYHTEVVGKGDFYAALATDRISKAGFIAGVSTEVVGGSGVSMTGAGCVLGLLNTAYHGPALLSSNTNIGIGAGLDAAAFPVCVADLATASGDALGLVPAAGALVAYPFGGQTGVAETFYVGNESPRPPVTLFPNATAGTPVIVSVRNADYVNFAAAGTLNAAVTTFTLKDASGNLVAAEILASPGLKAGAGVKLNADSVLQDGFVVLVPLAPLAKGQTYTVTFSATLKSGGAALAKTWAFTTAQ